MLHSVVRLTMDLPNASKTILSTMISQPPSQDSKNLSKLLMHDTGNEKEKSPVKPELLEPPEASPNRSPTPTSPTTSPAQRFFQFQAEEQQLRLYSGQGLNF